jgi:hypothetical protein
VLEALSRSAPAARIWAALERDGAVIVEDFLSEERRRGLLDDFGPHLDAVGWCNTESDSAGKVGDEFFGLRTKRLHGLPARSAHFGAFICDPLLAAMCERFLRPHCRDWRLSTGELMALGEGESEQLLHRDADSWHRFPEPRPEILVSVNAALTDFSGENGATVVVPGSHRWPRERQPRADEKAQAVMQRGSALLYSGNVLHGGGANRTPEPRVGLYAGFLLSWLRPLESYAITCGLDHLRAEPPAVRRLLAYTDAGWEVMP